MEHFYQDIHGWFSYDYIYSSMVDQAVGGELFVEIGSFKGKSTAFMCVEILNSSKNIRFDCIDPMQLMSHYVESAENEPEQWNDYTVEEFHRKLHSVRNYYHLHQMTSSQAATLYQPGSIDFLMIDGDHTYEAVKQDVIDFVPKMKSGGLIAGDDAFDPGVRQAAIDGAHAHGLRAEINGIHFFIKIP